MRKIISRIIFLLIMNLVWGSSVFSQIKGKVIDVTGKPLPYCQVGLIRASDSAIVIASSSDESGKFIFEAKDYGSFRITATYIGYKTFYSPVFSITKENKQYDAGNIVLEMDSKTIKNVDIIAQKPFMEYKSDRTVYNIENSIISAGNNALEVLKKLPGVKIDNNDNISVNGESGVLIMIDGRTSYMSATDAGNYLRSLDASQIEKIEVITNPSAKYDASGSVILNIIRKKNKNAGLNAIVTSGYAQGMYGRGNENMNVNYSVKKWNLFANYGYNFGQHFSDFGNNTIFSLNNRLQSIFADSN